MQAKNPGNTIDNEEAQTALNRFQHVRRRGLSLSPFENRGELVVNRMVKINSRAGHTNILKRGLPEWSNTTNVNNRAPLFLSGALEVDSSRPYLGTSRLGVGAEVSDWLGALKVMLGISKSGIAYS